MTRLAIYSAGRANDPRRDRPHRYAESKGVEAVWQADSRLVREAKRADGGVAATTDTIRIGSV